MDLINDTKKKKGFAQDSHKSKLNKELTKKKNKNKHISNISTIVDGKSDNENRKKKEHKKIFLDTEKDYPMAMYPKTPRLLETEKKKIMDVKEKLDSLINQKNNAKLLKEDLTKEIDEQKKLFDDLKQQYIKSCTNLKNDEIKFKVKPRFNLIYYSAFDIETVNLELTPDEQLQYLGEPSSMELVTSACNTPDDEFQPYLNEIRYMQIPVMIAYTKFVKHDERKNFSTENDIDKTKIFEIENPNVSNSDLIEQSLKMMNNFWESLHSDIQTIEEPLKQTYKKSHNKKTNIVDDIKILTKFFKGYDKSFLTKELKKGKKSKFIDKVNKMFTEKYTEILSDNMTKTEKEFIEKSIDYITDNTKPLDYAQDDTVKKLNKPIFYIYAHNLGRYDGIFMLKSFLQCEAENLFGKVPSTIFKNNTLVRMSISSNIHFLDSLQMMNSSLNSIANTMLGKSKLDTGYKTFSKELLIEWFQNKNEWIEFRNYLARDCSLLIDIIHILADLFFHKYNFILGQKSTISSTALHIFFNEYYTIEKGLQDNRFDFIFNKKISSKDTHELIYSLTGIQDAFIRSAFIGGRTEVFETFTGQIHSYDINSAYCAAMVEFPMPTGKPIGPYKVDDPIGFNLFEFNNFYGFIYATVSTPPDIDPPVLPYRNKNGTILYPRGIFTGYFFSEEAKTAKKHGYQIMVHETIAFKPNNNLFKDFINTTYNERLKYPKNSAENLFFKIIMLSVYGRFALNPESTSYAYGYGTDFLKKEMDCRTYQSHEEFLSINKRKIYIVKHQGQNDLINNFKKGSPFMTARKAHQALIAPQISAAISSYVRIILYNILSQKQTNGVVYTDTDSVFLKKPLDENLISPNKLGLWKYEGTFDTGIFIAKKLYKLWKFEENTYVPDSPKDSKDSSFFIHSNISHDPLKMTNHQISNTAVSQDLINKLKNNLKNSKIENSKIGVKGIPNSYLSLFKDTDWVDMLSEHPITKVLQGSIAENRVKIHKDYQKYKMELKPTDISVSNSTLDKSRQRVFDMYGNCITTLPHFINNTDYKAENEKEYYNLYRNLKNQLDLKLNKNDFYTYKNSYFSKKHKKFFNKLKLDKTYSPYKTNKKPLTELFSNWKRDSETNVLHKKNVDEILSMYEINIYKIQILLALKEYETIKPLPTRYISFIKKQLQVILNESISMSNMSPSEYIDNLINNTLNF